VRSNEIFASEAVSERSEQRPSPDAAHSGTVPSG
jgi:hypothetical protein